MLGAHQRPWSDAESLGHWLRLGALFLVVPLLIAVFGAANNWQLQQTVGTWDALAFYTAHALVPWWLSALMTWFCYRLLRPWRPPMLVIVILGGICGAIAAYPYANWLTSQFEAGRQGADTLSQVVPFASVQFLGHLGRAVVSWAGINWLFDRFLGLPRYRYDERTAASRSEALTPPEPQGEPVTPTPGFLRRIDDRVCAKDVLALKAEQHYVSVVTASNSFLVLYRFGDAVEEMAGEPGLQVHRSYWVNTDHIERAHAHSKRFTLTLTNGDVVPVSVPYQGMVREVLNRRADPA